MSRWRKIAKIMGLTTLVTVGGLLGFVHVRGRRRFDVALPLAEGIHIRRAMMAVTAVPSPIAIEYNRNMYVSVRPTVATADEPSLLTK